MSVTAVVEREPWAGLAAFLRGDLSWQDRALCAEADPEEFFLDKGGSTKRAKRICKACEVRAECLEYALEMEKGSLYSAYGIWGGLSPNERQAVAQARKPHAAALPAPGRAAPRPKRPQARALDNQLDNEPDKGAPEIGSPQAGDTGRPDSPADNEPGPAPAPEPEALPVPEPAPVLEAASAAAPKPARRHRKCGYPLGSIGHQIACGGPS